VESAQSLLRARELSRSLRGSRQTRARRPWRAAARGVHTHRCRQQHKLAALERPYARVSSAFTRSKNPRRRGASPAFSNVSEVTRASRPPSREAPRSRRAFLWRADAARARPWPGAGRPCVKTAVKKAGTPISGAGTYPCTDRPNDTETIGERSPATLMAGAK